MGRVVLVTGVARFLGENLVRRLGEDPGVDRVIGIDVVPPRSDLGRTEFVRADIRNPIIAKVIAAADVDTVVHMSVASTATDVANGASSKELNVIGTMQLLAACQKAPSLRRLVVKSTTTVYGASPRDPAMFTEDTEPKALPRTGFAKDAVEVEGYVRGFARRRADVEVTVLRFANFLGPRMSSAFASLFSLPVWPSVLGHDPRLQFVHPDDGLDVLKMATTGAHPGVYNVAGEGTLLYSQAARRSGSPTMAVPRPMVTGVASMLRRAGMADLSPELIRYLTYGRVVDTTRLQRFGFTPRYSTPATFEDFLNARGRGPITAERAAAAERRILAAVGALPGVASVERT